jgi:hypothetical protein
MKLNGERHFSRQRCLSGRELIDASEKDRPSTDEPLAGVEPADGVDRPVDPEVGDVDEAGEGLPDARPMASTSRRELAL